MNRRAATITLRIALITAAVIVAITGVSGWISPRVAVPQPTAVERELLDEQVREFYWMVLDLPSDAPRPAFEFREYVDPDESDEVHARCMRDAGYDDWSLTNGGGFGAPSVEKRLAFYGCISQYPPDPASYNFYTRAQRDAVYDYYAKQLVPCLAAAGVQLPNPPTRETFVESDVGLGALWNPMNDYYYFSSGELDPTEQRFVGLSCPDLSYSLISARE